MFKIVSAEVKVLPVKIKAKYICDAPFTFAITISHTSTYKCPLSPMVFPTAILVPEAIDDLKLHKPARECVSMSNLTLDSALINPNADAQNDCIRTPIRTICGTAEIVFFLSMLPCLVFPSEMSLQAVSV